MEKKSNYVNSNDFYKKQMIFSGIKTLHLLTSIALFYIFWMLFRYGKLIPQTDIGFRYNYLVTVGYGVVLYFFYRTYNAYLLGYSRIRELVISQTVSQFFTIIIVYFAVSAAWNKMYNPIWFLALIGSQIVLNIIWSYFSNVYYSKKNSSKNTVFIYKDELDKKRFGSIEGKPAQRIYKITKEYLFKY